MQINKARAFLAVATELHFGRAAARLHIAQPPLSRMIRSLEEELGASLFARSPHKVSLTPIGEALVEPTRELLMQSERITQLVRSLQQGETGRVRLGFSGSSVSAVVRSLLREVRDRAPALTVDLHGAQLSRPGLEQLMAGAIDAIVGRWDALPREVDSLVLAREDLVLALPENHPLAAAHMVPAAQVADEPWVILPGGGGSTLSTRLNEIARLGRFVPRIVATAADSVTQMLMVEAGNGIALTFSGVSTTVPAHAVAFRPIEPSLGEVEIRLAWLTASMGPALRTFIDFAVVDGVRSNTLRVL